MMKPAFRQSALSIVAILATVAGASANDPASPERYEAVLDIDRDGQMDRAVLVRHPSGASADLLIYLGAGSDALDPSRKPDIRKDDIASGHVMLLETRDKGSLIVRYGCGGCSNDYEMTLTIVHRGGHLLVAGFSYDWETRDYGTGHCDINFLTGSGVRSRGTVRPRRINARFAPVKLADWSVDKHPKACF